jgi:hypothetical protein
MIGTHEEQQTGKATGTTLDCARQHFTRHFTATCKLDWGSSGDVLGTADRKSASDQPEVDVVREFPAIGGFGVENLMQHCCWEACEAAHLRCTM